MNARQDFRAVADAFADEHLAKALKRAEDAHMLRQCAEVGGRDSKGEVQSIAANIAGLDTLTAPEMLLLVTVLAIKVRESNADYSDAIADAMEVELPNALWAITDDNPDNYPEEA